MNDVTKGFVFIALGLFSLAAIAAPKQLITHNTTDLESNAFVAGSIPSQHPTKAHSDGKVFWTAVKLACFGHTVNGQCGALIKMATNTSNPIEIGTLQMDVNSGAITPPQLSANGFTITVNGPGETTISKNP
jgi:hypothetical protein